MSGKIQVQQQPGWIVEESLTKRQIQAVKLMLPKIPESA
jgi:hypothetical protein